MRAVQAGDDALAKEALRRKAEKEADRIEAERRCPIQRAYSVQLGAGLKALQARVQDVKAAPGNPAREGACFQARREPDFKQDLSLREFRSNVRKDRKSRGRGGPQ